MNASTKVMIFAVTLIASTALSGCAGVGYYPSSGGYGYRGGGYGYNNPPYYGYGNYGNYGGYGYGNGYYDDDDD